MTTVILTMVMVALLIALLCSNDEGSRSIGLSIAFCVTLVLMVGYEIWNTMLPMLKV